jgi:uncharacterized protein (TIGR01370 family)
MRKFLKNAIAALLCLTGCAPAPKIAGITPIRTWAAYYDHKLPAKTFKDLDLVVFDRRYYPKFDDLKGKTIVLAYVSAGEVYDDVPERKILQEKNLLLFQNERWKSHAVDLTALEWQKIVMDQVDDAEAKGFDGVMLDTIDSPLYWAATKQPERLEALRQGAIDLIHAIRKSHPHMKIMLNRAFEILPSVAVDIDYSLAESILTNTDVSTGQFGLNPPEVYHQAAEQLQTVEALAPQLQVFTLDYWKQDDVKGLERIYAEQRANGFTPYVNTPALNTYTPEPPPPHMYNR